MNLKRNPFDLTKASDFTNAEINQYWVDITDGEEGLLDLINPRSVMPMQLLGSKGCGKTHLMRYCSAPVQLMRNNNDIREVLEKDQYLGVYVRADGLNVGRFSGKGQDDITWSSIFSYYFEIWITLNLLQIIKPFLETVNSNLVRNIATEITRLFDDDTTSKDIMDIKSLIDYLDSIRRNIDNTVNNCAINKAKIDIKIIFSMGKLIFGIPNILKENIDIFGKVVILYLIDEIENFNETQQKFINTLIRYRKENTGIKIGARLYGIKTCETIPPGEPIKLGAEFERVELDKFLREHGDDYFVFIDNLIKKRIRLSDATRNSDDKKIISSYFEEIDPSMYYKYLTLEIVASTDKKEMERHYFEKLRKNIKKFMKSDFIDDIILALKIPDFPLLEKINIYLFYKKFTKYGNLLDLAKTIGEEADKFINGNKQEAHEYEHIYKHYHNDMLAQLYRDYEKDISYAGLDTIVHLSQGSPRNVLGILKSIYQRSLFNGETPFANNSKITIKSQTEGINDASNWFFDDVQPDNHGVDAKKAIDNLAVFFRTIRYCNKPSECKISTFSVDINSLSDDARKTLENTENWSYIIRAKGRKNKNNQQIDQEFQLAPLLAPKWGLSYSRGGTINLEKELAEAIFSTDKDYFKHELEKRLKTISFEFKNGKTVIQDGLLFDDED